MAATIRSERIGRDALSPLHRQNTRTHAPLDSDLIKSLAGRPRWLYEMATGAPGGEADHLPSCPLNPSGRLGHDHSGPPYGSAFQHPLFSYGVGNAVGSYTIDDGTTTSWTNRAMLIYTSPTTDDYVANVVARVFVRPFPKAVPDTPYSRAYPYMTAISVLGSATMTVTTWTQARGYAARRSDTIAVTDTAYPGQFITGLGCYWDVEPGWNKFYMRLENDSAIADAITIYSVSGNQIVKRSH